MIIKILFLFNGRTDWAVYKEVEHGLGSYPGLVNARIKITDGIYEGYYSDAVGMFKLLTRSNSNKFQNSILLMEKNKKEQKKKTIFCRILLGLLA